MVNDCVTVLLAHPHGDPTVADPDPHRVEIIGRVNSGDDAVTTVLTELPDVVVVDSLIDDTDDHGVCRCLREWAPATKVLVVSPVDDEHCYQAILAGATGVVLDASGGGIGLAAAVRSLARGEGLILPRAASRLLCDIDEWSRHAGDPILPPPSLTATEREVLARIADGVSPTGIASRHDVTDHLVGLHVGYAIAKLHRYVMGNEYAASA